MPRYARYKRYYKKVYPRKRWASNIKSDTLDMTLNTSSTTVFKETLLCKNSAQTELPTPVILKFGRVKIKGDIRFSQTNVSQFTSCMVYCLFVPEGSIPTIQLISTHPEYLLGWTAVSLDSGSTFSLTSTLKRNLNSGDSIYVLFSIETTQTPSQNIAYNMFYTAQYWTTSA
uniref:Capsid protein n=1 Tax=ssDNA virus sp. TaxID=2593122 RepID=A0A894JS07_9VIRU|nr:capsid protein [ssDNA virus sp.]